MTYEPPVRVRRLPFQLDRGTSPATLKRPMSGIAHRRSLSTKLRIVILGSTLLALVLALGATIVTVYVRAHDELDERIVSYSVLALVLILLALAVTWAVSSWLQAIVTRPLAAMADIARDATQHGVLSRRATKLGDDEVGELVDAFNGLLAEIERRKSEQEAAAADKDREVVERMRLNEELERRVQMRTAQLQESNNDLIAATREAENANRAKSEFLSNMSHELRTPLNAILGYTEMMVDGLYGDMPEKAQTVLERVQSNGRHLLGLINDVLDLSKIEAGQLVLTIEDYSVADMVATVMSATESLARTKGIALGSAVAPGLPMGKGDARRLTQVLLNLVGNAIKFTDQGSVEIRGAAVGSNFELSVVDTGFGIAPEDQAKIFEEFQQVDNSSTRKKGGTGLGLSISRKIVELHGGAITVTSEIGKGSIFKVTIPVIATAAKEAA